MSYVGKIVFIIPEFTTGEIIEERNGEYLVKYRKTQHWFSAEDLRLWSEEIDEACGNNRKCWSICGEKL